MKMLTRRELGIFGGAFLAASAPAAAQQRVAAAESRAQPPSPAVIGLISGGVDGTYIRIAADLAAVLDDPARLRIVPVIGKGSVQNIDDILHLRGIDIGIVQSDVLAYIRQRKLLPGSDRAIDYIAKLYDEEVHVLTRPEIGRLQDLAGKPVNIDVRGSGTALTATTLFDAAGVAIRPVNDDQETAMTKLRQGDIAALVYVAGKPARLFSTLPPDSNLHLLPISMTPSLLEAYLPSQFDHADYPALIPEGTAVETIAVGAVMAVFAWPPGSDRYRMAARFVEIFFGELPRFRQAPRHPKWREVNLDAQVPGWTRFPAADEWLKRRAAGATTAAKP